MIRKTRSIKTGWCIFANSVTTLLVYLCPFSDNVVAVIDNLITADSIFVPVQRQVTDNLVT